MKFLLIDFIIYYILTRKLEMKFLFLISNYVRVNFNFFFVLDNLIFLINTIMIYKRVSNMNLYNEILIQWLKLTL
jgi:hypothetical protein